MSDGSATAPPRSERALLVLALACALVAVALDPVLRAVSPHVYLHTTIERRGPDAILYVGAGADPWGHPWEQGQDALGNPRLLPRGVLDPGLLGCGWSVGPNGENEWGVGDDIVLSPRARPALARVLGRASPARLLLVALALVWLWGLRWALGRTRAPTRLEDALRALHLAVVPALLAGRLAWDLAASPALPVPLHAPQGVLAPDTLAFAASAVALVVLAAVGWRFTRPAG